MPTAPQRDRHFLIPKPRCTDTIPALPDGKLAWLAGQLGPEERRAMRYICLTADVLEVDDAAYLLVPVDRDHRLVDALAAFKAEGEDRENDLDDEPDEGMEDDSVNANPADAGALEDEREPDVTHARTRFAQQRRRPQRTYTQMEGYRLVHQTNYERYDHHCRARRRARNWSHAYTRAHL